MHYLINNCKNDVLLQWSATYDRVYPNDTQRKLLTPSKHYLHLNSMCLLFFAEVLRLYSRRKFSFMIKYVILCFRYILLFRLCLFYVHLDNTKTMLNKSEVTHKPMI